MKQHAITAAVATMVLLIAAVTVSVYTSSRGTDTIPPVAAEEQAEENPELREAKKMVVEARADLAEAPAEEADFCREQLDRAEQRYGMLLEESIADTGE